MTFKTILFLFLAFQLHSQSNNTEYKNVPRTRVFIQPPINFSSADNIVGFMRDDYTYINVIDLNGGNFYSNTRNFSNAEFESRGVDLLELTDTIVDGFPAKFCIFQGKEDKTSKVIQVTFGDSTFSASLIGMFLSHDTQVEKQLKVCLLNAKYDKTFQFDPLISACFTFDDSKTVFQFSELISQMYLFSKNGKKQENSLNETVLLVSTFPSLPSVSPKGLSLKMTQGLQSNGIQLFLEDDIFRSQNGSEVYEAVYNAINGEKVFKLYCFSTKNEKNSLTVISHVYEDHERTINEIKELTKTFVLK